MPNGVSISLVCDRAYFRCWCGRHDTASLHPWHLHVHGTRGDKGNAAVLPPAQGPKAAREGLQRLAFVRMNLAKQQAQCGNFGSLPSAGRGLVQRRVLKRSPIAWLCVAIMCGPLPLKVNGSRAV